MKKTVCEINFTREGGEQILYIKGDKGLENLFKTATTETSGRYYDSEGDPLVYYTLNDRLSMYVQKYNGFITRGAQVAIKDYGTELMRSGYANMSVLRTKGLSSGISLKVEGLILEEEMKNWINDLSYFLKFLYKTFVEKAEVKVVINMEV